LCAKLKVSRVFLDTRVSTGANIQFPNCTKFVFAIFLSVVFIFVD
jgi:hypothetical protein